MKRVAILQPNYIPWKGYFDLIAAVDEFILYDDVRYTRGDWRNRNKIKTPEGTQWLTIPVLVTGKYQQKIFEAQVNGVDWAASHWRSIEMNYSRALYFDEISNWLKPLYLSASYDRIAVLDRQFIEAICTYLEIDTKISSSLDYTLIDGKTERVADLCVKAGGTEYISGPSAKDYIDESVFEDCGVKLTWFDYVGYKEYPQLWGDFVHEVSIIDLLMNCGKDSGEYMRYLP